MMGRGGLRKESSSSAQNLELNFKLLDRLKVISCQLVTTPDREGLAGAICREHVSREGTSNEEE